MSSIDTVFGEAQDKTTDTEKMATARTFAVRLAVHQDAESTAVTSLKPATYAQKTFTGFNYPRLVYCTLSDIEVILTQTGDGSGYGYIKYTQDCNSRRGDDVRGSDWDFRVDLKDSGGAYIRTINLGSWNHSCGKRLVELQENFTWVIGSINPITFAATATLWWTHKQEVSPC
ncbi:hypothetical protein QA633_41085 [Bradyrhizobium barranii]|uniref:hypothetical protein n=1 Tax=Bradyrhizobium barranii TaxID=2992140 RepID=UPI0024AEE7FB|nr:hypothetical protein [Bradyrhizobium barranii]WFT94580.1 hypothetical protein QA633_41085 [Bradyrhizobium barranii]